MSDLIERLRDWAEVDGGVIFTQAADALEAKDAEIERLRNEHREAELQWWDEKGELEEEISEKDAEIERLRAALEQAYSEQTQFGYNSQETYQMMGEALQGGKTIILGDGHEGYDKMKLGGIPLQDKDHV